MQKRYRAERGMVLPESLHIQYVIPTSLPAYICCLLLATELVSSVLSSQNYTTRPQKVAALFQNYTKNDPRNTSACIEHSLDYKHSSFGFWTDFSSRRSLLKYMTIYGQQRAGEECSVFSTHKHTEFP